MAEAKGLAFVYGGSDRVLNRQPADLTYPCLWLGVPEVRRRKEGTLKKTFDGWFVVMSDAPIDDLDMQDAAIDAMEALTEEIVAQMYDDYINALQFEFEPGDTVSHFKPRQTPDDAWGWLTEFNLIIPSTICP